MSSIGQRHFALAPRRTLAVAGVTALAIALLTACGTKHHAAALAGSLGINGGTASSVSSPPASTSAPAVAPASLTVSPADGASEVNPTAPITVTAAGGTIDTVALASSSGAAVAGALSPDKTTWTAAEPLGYGRSYTLNAAAVNADGKTAATTVTFTTLTPGNMTEPYINTTAGTDLTDGGVYGVGVVPVVHFDEPIDNEAAAEKALVVTTVPPVTGSWYWADDQNVHWRPQNYYASGTKVTVSADVYGVEVGPGLYGQSDVSKSFTIGAKQVSIADDTTHVVSVYVNDQLVRQMPTSMGKGGYATGSDGQQISFYTPSGTYTVLDKHPSVVMDSSTYGLPVNAPGGYRETIYNATRISTDGIYLHELDNTVWAQGNTDTSHGCLNLNQANAIWFQNMAQPGDPVQVLHTGGAPLALWQNGDWTLTWAQWQAGSALAAH